MERFRATVRRDHCVLRPFRIDLGFWLDQLGIEAEARDAIVLATHEAVANGMEHAVRGLVRVTGCVENAVICLEVSSLGPWADQIHALERGRGLALMRGLMSDVSVSGDSQHVTVRLRLQAEPRACSARQSRT